MFSNYLKMAFRSLKKNRLLSVINIIGLSVGMASFILILLYVKMENSYDRFHRDYDKIYRVESRFIQNDETKMAFATVSNGYMPAMAEEIPEIEQTCRIWLWDLDKVVQHNDLKFKEPNVYYVDPNFLTLFSFPMIKGNPAKALTEPNTIVITQHAASKYFGDENPIGKRLTINSQDGTDVCEVTGVLEDIPANSHIQFNFLISWKTMINRRPYQENFWYQHSAYGFVKLHDNCDPKAVENKFAVISEKHKTRNELKEYTWGIEMVPLENIHLKPMIQCEREVKGSRLAVIALLVSGILVLVIGWINFVNLTTAKSIERAREVGIRKVIGAGRGQLTQQFLFESVLINSIALIIALGLVEIFRPVLVSELGIISYSQIISPGFISIVAAVFIVGIVLSGFYPALVLASYRPIKILSGTFLKSRKGVTLRKGLVVFQFFAMIVLISASFIFFSQMNYVLNQNLGINTEQILVLKAPVGIDHNSDNIESFRASLLAHSSIISFTGSSSIPGKAVGMELANRLESESPEKNKLYEMLRTDPFFIETYDLKLLHGRGFSEQIQTDNRALVINTAATEYLGFKNPEDVLNQKIHVETSRDPFHVIGVVENYHHEFLKENYTPVMLFTPSNFSWIRKHYYSLKIQPEAVNETVFYVQGTWQEIFPNSVFDYFFLDDYFYAQYNADRHFQTILGVFTGLLIFIALIGLLGLVILACEQRTKEIGIRKILGAGTRQISYLFTKEYSVLIIISGILALPLAWWSAKKILADFAFRINLVSHFWIFPLAIFTALAISVTIILIQVLRVAKINPSVTLRNE